MKLLICSIFTGLCFSPALSIITEQAMDNLKQQQNRCIGLSGVSKDHLEMARLDRQIYADDYQEKFAVCMLKQFNIMNIDGSINHDNTSYTLLTDNPESFQAARNCVTLAGTNVRETARKIINCLLQTDIIVMDPRP